jgi:hypothetical protein
MDITKLRWFLRLRKSKYARAVIGCRKFSNTANALSIPQRGWLIDSSAPHMWYRRYE